MTREKMVEWGVLIFESILGLAAVILIIVWYDWKIALILFLWTWAQNLATENIINKKREHDE